MDAWFRYAIQLAIAVAGPAILLTIHDPGTRQALVATLSALCVLAWLVELAIIVGVHMGRIHLKWAPTLPLSIVLLVFLSITVTALPHLALALGSRPERDYTALAPVASVYSRWLRMVLMQIMLIGQGGYIRYTPVSLRAQLLSTALIWLGFVAKVVALAMIVRLVLAATRRVRQRGNAVVATKTLVRWRFAVYNVGLFFVSIGLVATMGRADENRPLAPRVLFAALATVAGAIAVVEVALSMHRLFARKHAHERPSVPRIAVQLLFYAHVAWMAIMTTVLFDAGKAWTLLVDDQDVVTAFQLWWRMLFVTLVALGPGGVSLVIPRRVWIECVLASVTVLWLFVLVLLLNVAISMTRNDDNDDDDEPKDSLVFNTQ